MYFIRDTLIGKWINYYMMNKMKESAEFHQICLDLEQKKVTASEAHDRVKRLFGVNEESACGCLGKRKIIEIYECKSCGRLHIYSTQYLPSY